MDYSDFEKTLKRIDPEELLRSYMEAKSGLTDIEAELPAYNWEETLKWLTNLTGMAIHVGVLKNASK